MKSYNGFTPAQRNKAQAWLNMQWKSGALLRPAFCHACGQEHGTIDAHTEDYSEPYEAGKTDAYHLCYRCHMMVHCRYKNREAWEKYKTEVARGVVFAPIYGRNFNVFVSQHLTTWAPHIERMREPPEYKPLEMID